MNSQNDHLITSNPEHIRSHQMIKQAQIDPTYDVSQNFHKEHHKRMIHDCVDLRC